LFVSRDKVFESENVLQETMIVKVDKSHSRSDVLISSSKSNKDFIDLNSITVPYRDVVFGAEKYVYLVTTEEELKVLKTLHQFKETLPSLGLKVKTGLTVDFRSQEYMRDTDEPGTVPCLYAQHIKNGRITFPLGKGSEYITTEKNSLVQQNRNYLIIKRFTAKEEKRRLQCGIYLSSDMPSYKYISTDNKVNFIEGNGQMTDALVYGLFVLFNSTLYDSY